MVESVAHGRTWSRLAFMGGMVQLLIVSVLLFTPTPLTCVFAQTACEPHGLLPFATSTTFVMFGAVGVLGLAVALSSHDSNRGRRVTVRWIAAGVMTLVTFSGIFGAGLALLPGTILTWIAAIVAPQR